MAYRINKGRTDKNQKEIVEALRNYGCSVTSLANVGDGCPDLLVGYKGVNYLFEVKDGSKTKSQTKLTPAQIKFQDAWLGSYKVVYSVDDALENVSS